MHSDCNTLKWGHGDGSFLIEALKVEGFHKLWPMLEPLFRKVVGEEVERALKNFTPKVAPW
jgi:hypothetical protein